MNARNVLLTLRDVEPQKGEWCLPGGFLEWGESPEEGGTRELFEETGITAEAFSPVGIYESRSGNRPHVLILVYHVTQWKGEPLPGDDASEVRWFNITDVPELAFSAHEQALAHVIRGMNQ